MNAGRPRPRRRLEREVHQCLPEDDGLRSAHGRGGSGSRPRRRPSRLGEVAGEGRILERPDPSSLASRRRAVGVGRSSVAADTRAAAGGGRRVCHGAPPTAAIGPPRRSPLPGLGSPGRAGRPPSSGPTFQRRGLRSRTQPCGTLTDHACTRLPTECGDRTLSPSPRTQFRCQISSDAQVLLALQRISEQLEQNPEECTLTIHPNDRLRSWCISAI